MIRRITIKNFKAFEHINLDFSSINLLIGENDSGKSSVLQALDCFFNSENVDKSFVRNLDKPVEITLLFDDGVQQSKIFKPKSFKFDASESLFDQSYLSKYRYIFLSANQLDPRKLIVELSSSKIDSKISQEEKERLLKIFQGCIDETLNSMNKDIFVVNPNITELFGETQLVLPSAAKFTIKSSGVPIEARGSGYQKNLIYSLLAGQTYDNVLLGIDEIENSFSLNNVRSLVNVLKQNFRQLIVTSHSSTILKEFDESDFIPLIGGECANLSSVISLLGSDDEATFVIVEGKTDVEWISTAIKLLGKKGKFIVLQAGGDGNVDHLAKELEACGKNVLRIKDGDSKDGSCSLRKETIELYIPIEIYQKFVDPDAIKVPETKKQFENEYYRIKGKELGKSFKENVANCAKEFLTIDSEFVCEIKELLGIG